MPFTRQAMVSHLMDSVVSGKAKRAHPRGPPSSALADSLYNTQRLLNSEYLSMEIPRFRRQFNPTIPKNEHLAPNRLDIGLQLFDTGRMEFLSRWGI